MDTPLPPTGTRNLDRRGRKGLSHSAETPPWGRTSIQSISLLLIVLLCTYCSQEKVCLSEGRLRLVLRRKLQRPYSHIRHRKCVLIFKTHFKTHFWLKIEKTLVYLFIFWAIFVNFQRLKKNKTWFNIEIFYNLVNKSIKYFNNTRNNGTHWVKGSRRKELYC